MPLIRRLIAFLTVATTLALAGCSGLSLAYKQFPLIAGIWADSYFDLDSDQRDRLKEQLQALQAWHRREELPQWQALLRQAHGALEGGVTRDELLSLERGARASAERSLQHAAPLVAPLLAELKPEQWQHLQKKLDEKTAEWREKHTGRRGPGERAKRYSDNLERWLGDLGRDTRRQARSDAEAWHFDLATMAQGRATRQARTMEALHAWARQDLASGTALFMRNLQPLPTEQAYREEIIASVVKLLNGLTPAQRREVHQHWSDWENELRNLRGG